MKRVISSICLLMILFIFQTFDASGQIIMPYTIQGFLKDGGVPANGNYDISYNLYDTETSTTIVGGNNHSNVSVVNGIFSFTEPGYAAFHTPGRVLWIEFGFKPAFSQQPYTILSPRQRLGAVPFSISSLISLDSMKLGGADASQFVLTNDSRLSDARTPIAGNANYIQNTGTLQTANFNISGTGTAAILNANQFNLGGFKMLSNGGLLDNLFLGLNSGMSNAGGSANAFFGTNAGRDNTSGLGNAFFGWQSGASNTTGIDNSFFGASPGTSNTTGSNNSFFGRQTGALNVSGSNNSAFGYYSLFNNSIGANNSTLGYRAGFGITTGSRNTFIGTSSGASTTTESNNTTLGYQADTSAGITNATALGNLAKVTQSNSLVLGSINGVNGATADTSVGIGTTAPNTNSKLHVNGSVRVTNGYIFITNPNTVIITSPNGACWGITVNNSGGLATFPVNPCP